MIRLRKKKSLYFYQLNIFLTPDKKPFYAGTYFPKNDRYGRPGLISVLKSISKAWDDKSVGFFLNAHDSEELILRPKDVYDGAIPFCIYVKIVLVLNQLMMYNILINTCRFNEVKYWMY